MKGKIDWSKFSTSEIKIKMMELSNQYDNLENAISEFLKILDTVNIEYINAKKELSHRVDL